MLPFPTRISLHLERASWIVTAVSTLQVLQLVTTSNSNSQNKSETQKQSIMNLLFHRLPVFERVQPICKLGSRAKAKASENIAAHGPLRVLHCIAPSHTGRLEPSNRDRLKENSPRVHPFSSSHLFCPAN